MVDQTGAIWTPNTNYFANRSGYKPLYIILHATAGGTSAEAIANYFASTQGTANPVSSHYVIGQGGELVQCVAENNGAWANGFISAGADPWWSSAVNPNNITISIEHCKPSIDNSDSLTSAQQITSFALIRSICERWNIPMRAADANGGITGHYSIDPINRSHCPGPYPWDKLWSLLQEEQMVIDLSMPEVARYFQAAGQMWARKDKPSIVIGNAMLDFYKAFGGNGLCGLTYLGLPLGNEIGIGGGCTLQPCERGIMCYDPARQKDSPPGASGMVYLAHLNILPPPQNSADAAMQTTLKQIYSLVQQYK